MSDKQCVEIQVSAMDALMGIIQSFPFFKKHRKGHLFLNKIDLIEFFIKLAYPDEVVLILFDCKKAFTTIPKLIIKKRDDFSTYMLGISNDLVLIEFSDIKVAEDWAYSLPVESDLTYIIYNKGIAYRNDRGLIDG